MKKSFLFFISLLITILSFLPKQTFAQTVNLETNLPPSNNKYDELRSLALSATPQSLKLKFNNKIKTVFGIVMDWDINDGVATIVAYQTGDVSMYLSNGQIYIGGAAKLPVKNAGLNFANEAKHYISKATETKEAPLPDKNCVRFYLLTNHGKFTFQEKFENLENKTSAWTKLFDLGNIVVTEYRKVVFNK